MSTSIAPVVPLKEISIPHYNLPDGTVVHFTLTYQVFGRALHDAPIIMINHALTGNSKVCGPSGWWNKIVGEHQTIDLQQYTVIAFNIPGNAISGPLYSIQYKQLSSKIIADLFWAGLKQLKVNHLYALIGSSLGGGIAWEMAFLKPKAIRYLIPIACNLKASSWVKGQCFLQEKILTQAKQSVALARMQAMLFYRTPQSLENKFNSTTNKDTSKNIEEWLLYHGKVLEKRFPKTSYQLMNHLLQTIGKNRTWIDILNFALQTETRILQIAIDSDILFTQEEQEKTYTFIKKYYQNIQLRTLYSPHGHDAFLMEHQQLHQLLSPLF